MTEVKVVINGKPNKVYSQGIVKPSDFWEEMYRKFGKHETSMTPTKFYSGNIFGLFVDLRSMRDNMLHGSGKKMVNTKEGVTFGLLKSSFLRPPSYVKGQR